MRNTWARITCASWSRSRIFSSTLSTFVCREAPCNLPPVELVHAALVFEHTGLGCCLEPVMARCGRDSNCCVAETNAPFGHSHNIYGDVVTDEMADAHWGAVLLPDSGNAQVNVLQRLSADELAARPSIEPQIMVEHVRRNRLFLDLRPNDSIISVFCNCRWIRLLPPRNTFE